MTINAANLSTGTLNTLLSSSSSSSSSSSTSLTEDEKNYDVNNDGVLSSTEKVAMLESQLKEKMMEASTKYSASTQGTDTAEISQEGMRMHRQGPPPNVEDMSDEDLKNMLDKMKERGGQLPKELNNYNETATEDLTEEDLSNIRQIMTEMQESFQSKMESVAQNPMQRRMNEAITMYQNFSVDIL